MTNQSFVAVVDDDQAIREALCLVLDSVDLVARGYSSALAFLNDERNKACACLVLDVRMPGVSGLELQRRLLDMHCIVPIVFMSGHGDVSTAVEVMKKGAVDFLQKPFSNQSLIDVVQATISRTNRQREAAQRCEILKQRLATLTPRERAIFDAIGSGRVAKQVADDLGICVKTVEQHRTHIFSKLQIRRTSELTAMATELLHIDRD
ncbi:MAG: response regulator transcription factor [Rhodocyclales bacterium]|nr:response regulator transcription factor [Rhodocyclales bacterium]